MRVIVATRNAHKLREIRAILGSGGVELVGLDAFPSAPEVEEDEETFEGNAVKKAVTVARACGLPALGDDSGLEVFALNSAPGVRSARYAGEPPDHAANNRKLLDALRAATDRRARFRCVLALAAPDGSVRTVEGRCEGSIATVPRGVHGFGYDPVFLPEGAERTFAEMEPAEKNRLSHRARALMAARSVWNEFRATADVPHPRPAGR